MAKKEGNPATAFTLPSDREILIVRSFRAPLIQLWEAFTKPEYIEKWWGQKKLTTSVDTMDVVPGGIWRFVHQGQQGKECAFHGTYKEVSPLTRLAYTFESEDMPGHISLETVIFRESGEAVTIMNRSVFKTPEDRDAMLHAEKESDVRESMDRLAKLVE